MFKSNAQRKYMEWAASKGKIKKSVVEEFEAATPKGAQLPEHVDTKKKYIKMKLGKK
jgi:hypothetical protein